MCWNWRGREILSWETGNGGMVVGVVREWYFQGRGGSEVQPSTIQAAPWSFSEAGMLSGDFSAASVLETLDTPSLGTAGRGLTALKAAGKALKLGFHPLGCIQLLGPG